MREPTARRVTTARPASWSRTFPATASQVPQARHSLTALLDGSPFTADAAICLTELVTNAILHSRSGRPGGQFTVRAALSRTGILVEVADQGGTWAPCHDSDGQRGRGLAIVRELATSFGISGDDVGRVAWFLIGFPPGQI